MPSRMWGKTMSTVKFGQGLSLVLGLFAAAGAWAQTQVTASDFSTSPNGDVTITLSTSGAEPNVSVFATDSPARIVLDMADTTSRVDAAPVTVGRGAVQAFSTLSAGGRTRVLVDLSRAAEFEYSTAGNAVVLTIAGQQAVAAAAAETVRTPGQLRC